MKVDKIKSIHETKSEKKNEIINIWKYRNPKNTRKKIKTQKSKIKKENLKSVHESFKKRIWK